MHRTWPVLKVKSPADSCSACLVRYCFEQRTVYNPSMTSIGWQNIMCVLNLLLLLSTVSNKFAAHMVSSLTKLTIQQGLLCCHQDPLELIAVMVGASAMRRADRTALAMSQGPAGAG